MQNWQYLKGPLIKPNWKFWLYSRICKVPLRNRSVIKIFKKGFSDRWDKNKWNDGLWGGRQVIYSPRSRSTSLLPRLERARNIPLHLSFISKLRVLSFFVRTPSPYRFFLAPFLLCGTFPEVVAHTEHLMEIPKLFALLLTICVLQAPCIWCRLAGSVSGTYGMYVLPMSVSNAWSWWGAL